MVSAGQSPKDWISATGSKEQVIVAILEDGRILELPATIEGVFRPRPTGLATSFATGVPTLAVPATYEVTLRLVDGVYQFESFQVSRESRDEPLTATEMTQIQFGLVRFAIVDCWFREHLEELLENIQEELDAVTDANSGGRRVVQPTKEAMDAVTTWWYCVTRSVGQQIHGMGYTPMWTRDLIGEPEFASAWTQRAFRLRKAGIIFQEGTNAKDN